MGKSEDKCAGMKRMYYQEYRNVIVPAHPKEDVNASGEDKEKKVGKEEKNRNTFCIYEEAARPWTSILMLLTGSRTHDHADKDDRVTCMIQIINM